MKISAYQRFAEVHAQRVGGQRLLDAMLRQINGEDEDVAEINWRVLGYDNSTEVYANVSANYDKSVIRFSIDERQPAITPEFSTSIDFTIHIRDEGLFLERGPDLSNDEDLILEALAEFARIAVPDKQGD